MGDLNRELNIIRLLMKECEQTSLEHFAYKDTILSVQFSKTINNVSFKDAKESTGSSLNYLELDRNTNKKMSKVEDREKRDIVIVSPFVGTIEFSDMIKEGSNNVYINKDEIICTVEAMKIYNDIKATISGTIIEIYVKDYSIVEYEQPILKIRADKNE